MKLTYLLRGIYSQEVIKISSQGDFILKKNYIVALEIHKISYDRKPEAARKI